MMNPRHVIRPVVLALALSLLCLAAVPAAYGQFTLTASPLQPAAVDPGGSATATIDLTMNGFTGTVDLTCAVTSGQVATDLPACAVSPTSETASSLPSLTITTSGSTPAGTYQITITGIGAGSLNATVTLNLNVADLAVDYTISVYPTTAIPSPVTAGSIATSTVTVAPLGSYSGSVTLSCLAETPVVAGAPICSFTPPNVSIAGGLSATSTLTLTTYGYVNSPPPTTKLSRPRAFYAFWLGLPALAFMGLSRGGKRWRKLFGIFLLLAIAGGLFLVPACGNSASNINTNVNQITPANTYTFTLSGADAKGIGPSSTSSSTVMLQVNSD